MINDILTKMGCFRHDYIYELLAYQHPKLCLDVGAAAGLITKRIKEATSEENRVIAFEPFEGNHQYFFDNTQAFKNVELIKKAVAAQAGTARFCVPSVVKGNEKGWESMPGYSSVGYLARGNQAAPTGEGSQEFSIETIALDDVVNEHVDFMKIDVQGRELEVLKGCETVIKTHGLDVMYIEFNGDRRVIDLLYSLGYTIFDTDYLIISDDLDPELLQELGFYDFQGSRLSTGKRAFKAKLRLADQDYCSFILDFRKKYGSIQTDLICVSDQFLDAFLMNLSDFAREQPVGDRPRYTAAPKPVTSPPVATSATPGALPSGGAIAPSKKAQNNGQKKTQQLHLEAPKVQPHKPEPVPAPQPAAALIQRIAHYYSRWPLTVAILAIALHGLAFLNPQYQWVLITAGTAVLLFLIGHAASKADYVLNEVDKLRNHPKLRE